MTDDRFRSTVYPRDAGSRPHYSHERRTAIVRVSFWQGAYAELVFFSEALAGVFRKDLDAAIEEYNHRERRFGGRS